ncbi:PAS domain S-box protein [Caulobacter sp. DWR2-3-1b2]|uniref:PAS domain S-box protein n=1 Tax=Caulobacter sp. DWR2-3-1b2 TaxID=2804642 RepID=UPI003CF00745
MTTVTAGTLHSDLRPRAYLAALATVAACCLVQLALPPAFNASSAFLLFVPAVLISAAVGGLAPGLFATVLAAAAVWALKARGLHDQATALSSLVFVMIGVGMSIGGGWFHAARRRAAAMTHHLQSILDSAPDAVIVIDPAGLMTSFSPAAERLFGWSAAEAIGRNVSSLMPGPHREGHDGYLANYARSREPKIIGTGRVVVGQRKDGSTFPMELAVGETRGSSPFYTGFIRDLTDRQQTETRLRDLQTELVHVSRLTAMGEMASTLAHELNQPLSAIANLLTGSRRLLDRGRPEDQAKVRDAVDKASAQALRAGDVIHRMREFVRRGASERAPERLSMVVEDAAALALIGAREHLVTTRLKLDPTADAVYADRVQIQQVLVNLIRNAVDAMADSPRRELTIASQRLDSDSVQVSVTDTGSGINDDFRERLFQPFMTTKAEGMGVGLSISRSIIEAHGGRIWADANPKGGTVFHFTLPPQHDHARHDDESPINE